MKGASAEDTDAEDTSAEDTYAKGGRASETGTREDAEHGDNDDERNELSSCS